MNAISKLAIVLLVAGIVLVSGPTFGFSSLAADRSVAISTADSNTANLAVTLTDTVVDDPDEPHDAVRITNNADENFELDVSTTILESGLEESATFDAELPAGESTSYAVTCEPGTGSGTTDVQVAVDSATSDQLIIEDVVETVSVERACSDPSDPGPGFDSIAASDVSGFVTPGEEQQTFSFTLAGDRQPDEQIEIDLSEPRDNGVNYEKTFQGTSDIQVEHGNGSVWTNGNSIIYQVSSEDDHGDEIRITAEGYSTDGDGGPYDVVFTRTDTGEQGMTQFEIDGEDGGDEPFMDVTVDNVRADDTRQTFGFTVGQRIESWEQVHIDISDPNGNDIDYDWDIRLEQGPGSDDNVWRSGDEIVFQANEEQNAGEDIVVSAGTDVTGTDNGPYEVTFTRTDTGDQTTDTFDVTDR